MYNMEYGNEETGEHWQALSICGLEAAPKANTPVVVDSLMDLYKDSTVFFITHDVGEAVYLADRVYILSNSPGTILHQMKVMPPDRPAKVMAREKPFQDSVLEISGLLDELEEGKD